MLFNHTLCTTRIKWFFKPAVTFEDISEKRTYGHTCTDNVVQKSVNSSDLFLFYIKCKIYILLQFTFKILH